MERRSSSSIKQPGEEAPSGNRPTPLRTPSAFHARCSMVYALLQYVIGSRTHQMQERSSVCVCVCVCGRDRVFLARVLVCVCALSSLQLTHKRAQEDTVPLAAHRGVWDESNAFIPPELQTQTEMIQIHMTQFGLRCFCWTESFLIFGKLENDLLAGDHLTPYAHSLIEALGRTNITPSLRRDPDAFTQLQLLLCSGGVKQVALSICFTHSFTCQGLICLCWGTEQKKRKNKKKASLTPVMRREQCVPKPSTTASRGLVISLLLQESPHPLGEIEHCVREHLSSGADGEKEGVRERDEERKMRE
ncbi:hypothetical protein DNTS_019010 [Danionella cerebrum]|uniref:Uncharacterized protein n=1 Tax=Danionella cerebrum TaxID=2873325 RepID=A0A553RJL5_9TELE|nr:hypothetical protein DNTS_019010 [Danionella translucida]